MKDALTSYGQLFTGRVAKVADAPSRDVSVGGSGARSSGSNPDPSTNFLDKFLDELDPKSFFVENSPLNKFLEDLAK